MPDVPYNSVENAYVGWKTPAYGSRIDISHMTPGDAKKLSKAPVEQTGFVLRDDYNDDSRIAIMRNFVQQKFSYKNPELLNLLLETKDALLVEGNTWEDTFFGFDLDKGYGQNNLGRILMDVRQLRQQAAAKPHA